ncbi:hypothetical protein KRR40_19555 [Niabella defluvii]|nr:hypothetical protein KRR40_19555 [Niabella sp. I65]
MAAGFFLKNNRSFACRYQANSSRKIITATYIHISLSEKLICGASQVSGGGMPFFT